MIAFLPPTPPGAGSFLEPPSTALEPLTALPGFPLPSEPNRPSSTPIARAAVDRAPQPAEFQGGFS